MHHFKEQFHQAYDLTTTETGASLQAIGMGTFEDSIHKICPYYFDLMEVFGDQASAKPKVTSTEKLDSSEEEQSELNNDYDMNDDEEKVEQEMEDDINETLFGMT